MDKRSSDAPNDDTTVGGAPAPAAAAKRAKTDTDDAAQDDHEAVVEFISMKAREYMEKHKICHSSSFCDVLCYNPVLPLRHTAKEVNEMLAHIKETDGRLRVYYAVDIETTGPRKIDNWMCQIGAAAFVHHDNTVLLLSVFEGKVAPPSAAHCFDEDTLKTFWRRDVRTEKHMHELLRLGEPVRKVFGELIAWLDSFAADSYQQLLDVPQFDSAWLDMYHEMYTDIKRPLYLRRLNAITGRPLFEPAIGTDDAIRGVVKSIAQSWVSTEAACAKVGVPFYRNPHQHDAAYDALAIGVNFFRIAAKEKWDM